MIETDRAYLAGILDGDGCVSFAHRLKKYITPIVMITNTNFLIIDWLQSKYPKGSWYSVKETRPTRKPLYEWRSAGEIARQMIRDAYPYLILKKPQADLILAQRNFFGKRMAPSDFLENDRLVHEIRFLNRRGNGTSG